MDDAESRRSRVASTRPAESEEPGVRTSEGTFRSAMQYSPIGMALVAPDGTFLEVNEALCKIVGYSREELLRGTFQDITHPDDLETDLTFVHQVLDGHIETYQMDKRYLHKNGGLVWIQLNVSLVRRADGSPDYFVSQIQDITARKLVEQVIEIVSTKLLFLDGPEFYTAVVRDLSRVLGAEIAFVARINQDQPDTLHTIALIEDGELVENISHPIPGTPCAKVVDGTHYIVADNAQALYPSDTYLVEKRIRAYAATPLIGPDGRVFGHLGALKREPFTNSEAIAQTLNSFGLAVSSQMMRDSNRRQYRDLFELAPDGLLITNRRGDIIEANQQAQALFGRPRDSLCRHNVRALLPLTGDDASDPWGGFLQSTRPRHPSMVSSGFNARRPDGSTRPVDINLNPIETDEGAMLVISIRDIAERLESQRALRLRDRAIDAAGVGMMILASGRDNLRILDINHAFEVITGFARDEVVGRGLFDVLARLEAGRDVEKIRTSISQGKPGFAMLKCHRKSGAPFWSEIGISPVAGEDGTEIKFVGIINDVTDRVDTEQKLRIMADALPVLLVYFDKDNRYRMVNRTAEQWLARPASDIIGTTADAVVLPEHINDYRKRTANAPTDRETTFEARYAYPDGKTRLVEVHHIPHVDADGTLAGHYTMVIDITERENVRAHLNQTQRMESIGQLSGGVAHDFNNLLSVIQGNLQLLSRRNEIDGDESTKRWVNSALDAVSRGADLTQRLLAFSRRQPLENTIIDVTEHLAEMSVLLQRAVGELVNIETRLDPDLPCIEGDLSQFENVVLNLAVNARDAMPRGGTLSIETSKRTLVEGDLEVHTDLPPGEYVLIAVRDDGVGMESAVHARAFEPFFTTKEPGRGTGLGLASVFGYVKQCGGHAAISSEPGEGTTVELYFPVSGRSGETPRKSPANVTRRPSGTETILAVDDNPEVLAAGAEMLRDIGYRVLEASNGAHALRLLEGDTEVDLVFTDMVMPGGMSGLELAERVRDRWPGTPILFTSGYAEEAMRRGGAGIELSEWIHKPIDIDELETKIATLLDSSRSTTRENEH